MKVYSYAMSKNAGNWTGLLPKANVQAITSIQEGMLESCNGFRKPRKFG